MNNTRDVFFNLDNVDAFANSIGVDTFLEITKAIEQARANVHEKQMVVKESKKTYLIKNNRNGLTKIGKSIEPNTRLKTLQGEDPDLEILHITNDDIESKLHFIYRVKRKLGEWFNLTKKDIQNIKDGRY